jgi:hypothetical protein
MLNSVGDIGSVTILNTVLCKMLESVTILNTVPLKHLKFEFLIRL